MQRAIFGHIIGCQRSTRRASGSGARMGDERKLLRAAVDRHVVVILWTAMEKGRLTARTSRSIWRLKARTHCAANMH